MNLIGMFRLSKVYISRSYVRNLKAGDIVVFYRTGGIYQEYQQLMELWNL